MLKLSSHLYPHYDEGIFTDKKLQAEFLLIAAERYAVNFLEQRVILYDTCKTSRLGRSFRPQPSSILPGLYISDRYTATSPQVLDDLGINKVLSYNAAFNFGARFESLHLTTEAGAADGFINTLAEATTFIHQALQNEGRTRLLVYCFKGVDSSPAVVVAYLIARYRWDYKKAIAHVKACRPVIKIDSSTKRQLKVLQALIRISTERRLDRGVKRNTRQDAHSLTIMFSHPTLYPWVRALCATFSILCFTTLTFVFAVF